MNKTGKTGINRIVSAIGYSFKGLGFAWKNEAAFRQEIILAIIFVPLAFYLSNSAIELGVLLLPIFLTLVVEIINSSIEAIVDRVGTEKHELSGAAKDLGSAAVFVSLTLWVLIWAGFVGERFCS